MAAAQRGGERGKCASDGIKRRPLPERTGTTSSEIRHQHFIRITAECQTERSCNVGRNKKAKKSPPEEIR